MRPYKHTLCLDFDGVLHSYSSGWQGAHIVADPPVPGAMKFLDEARLLFNIAIFSSRSNQPGGEDAMRGWLQAHLEKEYGWEKAREIIDDIDFPREKPPAFLTIDDRASTFEGTFYTPEEYLEFVPWNK